MKFLSSGKRDISRRLLGTALAAAAMTLTPLTPAEQRASAQAQVVVWANTGEDKVTRDELRVSRDGQNVVNSAWDGTAIRMFGLRNEVVNFAAILEAPAALAQVSVSFNSLTGPEGANISSIPAASNEVFRFVGRPIELFYVRYLQIRGLSRVSYDTYDERHVPEKLRRPHDSQGNGSGGWFDRPNHDKYYPEIAVPHELVPTFSMPAGTSQTIWADVYIPKNVPAGMYFGEFVVRSGGIIVRTVPVQLEVYDASLPDMPSAKTMLYYSPTNLNYRYLGARYPDPNSSAGEQAKQLRDVHFLMVHRHRVSLIGESSADECGLVNVDHPCPEWEPRLDGSLFTAANGYDGPGTNTGNNVYSIATYGGWYWQNQGESGMRLHTNNWENWFQQHSPETERFLYLIDESPNAAQIETWSRWMLDNPGPGGQLRSFATIGLPRADAEAPSLAIVASTIGVGMPSQWQPLADVYTGDPRKRFYLYNAHRPASGSSATEDDGVAMRELVWGQYKKGINRWFIWESTYYRDFQGGRGETNVFQNAQTFGGAPTFNANLGLTGWNYANGDGVLLYPGTDRIFPADSYGVMGPFASLRLKYWRRGIQDVDYITRAAAIDPAQVQAIVDEMIPKVLWDYGVNDPNDPTWVRTAISWSSNPDVWEAARRRLADIIVAASTSGPQVTLVAPLVLSPASPSVNQPTQATFTIRNTGAQPASLAYVFVGARDPSNAHVDFPVSPALTLQPGEQYTYQGSRAFSSVGSYRAWPAFYDGTNWVELTADHTTFAVQAQSPGQLTLTTALALSPASPAVNQPTEGTFTVRNTGGQTMNVPYLVIGARTPSNANVDFPVSAPLTLHPGDAFTYRATRSFPASGSYTAWPAYYTGSSWVELAPSRSAFTVGTASPSTIRIEESDAAVVKGPGQWNWTSGSDSRASGGTHIAAAGAGSTIRLSFTGTAVTLIGILDSCSGRSTVDVDGVSQTVDGYRASGGGWQQVLHRRSGLADTSHTLTLTVLGTKDPNSCGAWVYIDAVDVQR
jgi:hypothetical protein